MVLLLIVSVALPRNRRCRCRRLLRFRPELPLMVLLLIVSVALPKH